MAVTTVNAKADSCNDPQIDMTTATPLRRALGDLPLNTMSTPSSTAKIQELQAGQKRPFWALCEPETLSEPTRVRLFENRGKSLVTKAWQKVHWPRTLGVKSVGAEAAD